MSSRQNQEIPGYGSDFSGGMAAVKQPTTLTPTEYAVMDNIVVKPQGAGFRSRNGNSKHNATVMESAAAVTGLGFYKAAGVESLLAVCGGKVKLSSALSGTMTDITGSLTISTTATDRWTIFQADDITIGVGGAPNAPWMYTGTGNASTLAGTPPTADTGFYHANRVFLITAATSKLNWSVLDNGQDYTGSGSGSLFVQAGDGDDLVVGLPLNINTVLLLKQNSTHVMTGRTAPFPSFPLFAKVGCIGKHAATVVDGLAHWITPSAKLAISDGARLYDNKDLPSLANMDGVLASLDGLENIQMVRHQGADFDWLVISGTSEDSTTNDYAAVWDLTNKCWLECTTGFEANVFGIASDSVLYMGGSDGFVYRMDDASAHTDASNASAAVDWTLETDWLSRSGLLKNVAQVSQVNVAYLGAKTGTMAFEYGYDFIEPLSGSGTFSIITQGALWDVSLWDVGRWAGYVGKLANPRILGRGNVFKLRLSGSSGVRYDVYKFSLFGKDNAQKNFGAR